MPYFHDMRINTSLYSEFPPAFNHRTVMFLHSACIHVYNSVLVVSMVISSCTVAVQMACTTTFLVRMLQPFLFECSNLIGK